MPSLLNMVVLSKSFTRNDLKTHSFDGSVRSLQHLVAKLTLPMDNTVGKPMGLAVGVIVALLVGATCKVIGMPVGVAALH